MFSLSFLCSFDGRGRFTQVDPDCEKVLGYLPSELVGKRITEIVVPEDRESTLANTQETGRDVSTYSFRNRVFHQNGERINLLWSVVWSETCQRMSSICYDVDRIASKQHPAVPRTSGPQRGGSVLRLREVLEEICKIAEAQIPGTWCAIFQVDSSGEHILFTAGPSLPDALSQVTHGMTLGSGAGGTTEAVSRRQMVLIIDVQNDRLWRNYREIALEHGIRSSLSFPLLSGEGVVLGAITLYFKYPYSYDDEVQRVFATARDLAAITIERVREQLGQQEKEEHLKSLFLLNPEAVFSLDLNGSFKSVNPSCLKILGFNEAEVIGQRGDILVAEEDRLSARAYFHAVAQGGEPLTQEVRVIDRWGRTLIMETTSFPIKVSGIPVGLFCIAKDVTESKVHERQLRLFQKGIEVSQNGILITDALANDMPIVYANPAFERITGYRAEDVIGRNCRFLQGEHADAEQLSVLKNAIAQGVDVSVVLQNRRSDGSPFWNELFVSPIHDRAGKLTHFVGVQRDITEQKKYETELAHGAKHDALTGLPNRSLMEFRLAQAALVSGRAGSYLAVLFIDLDGFKPINDLFGHGCGDKLLMEVASRIVRHVKSGDTVARMGGDEFIVILPELDDLSGVSQLAGDLLEAISEPFDINDMRLDITASIGIAWSEGETKQPMRLIQQADLAMYRAKEEGRNNYYWYRDELEASVSDRLLLRSDLQRAIDHKDFELHYQPQVKAGSGRVLGVEALIRWKHPDKGMIPPSRFIPLAEQTGQINAIGKWVLDTACAQAKKLIRGGFDEMVMCVNVSAIQIQRSDIFATVRDALQKNNLPGRCLELEITESVLLHNTDKVISSLRQLKTLGVKIAIDDFGTGFSCLSYLKQLPIDRLKIDQVFVRDINTNNYDAAIARAVISLAHDFGLRVIAEGVETENQLDYLTAEGCDEFQGYFISRPLEFSALQAFLHRRSFDHLSSHEPRSNTVTAK